MYSLVGIHGAPRSGTSWLGQLFNSCACVAYRYQPFFSYAFRGRIHSASGSTAIRQLFDELLESDDAFVNQSGTAQLARSTPRFAKGEPTHLVYKEVRFHDLIEPIMAAVPDARYVGIVRDPRDVLDSWLHAPREFSPEWSFLSEWRDAPAKNAGLAENWYGFNRWKELAGLFQHLARLHPARFRIVRYEDLVRDTVATVCSLFAFCGLEMTDQTRRFILESTSRDDGEPYGVFRQHGVLARRRLPAKVEEAIVSELARTPLASFLARDP